MCRIECRALQTADVPGSTRQPDPAEVVMPGCTVHDCLLLVRRMYWRCEHRPRRSPSMGIRGGLLCFLRTRRMPLRRRDSGLPLRSSGSSGPMLQSVAAHSTITCRAVRDYAMATAFHSSGPILLTPRNESRQNVAAQEVCLTSYWVSTLSSTLTGRTETQFRPWPRQDGRQGHPSLMACGERWVDRSSCPFRCRLPGPVPALPPLPTGPPECDGVAARI
jgi:hypothetical protein